MNLLVIGEAFTGKTPFSIQVSAAAGWDHVEALDWLRGHFKTTDYAHMMLDTQLMDRILAEELERFPRACLHYVKTMVHAERSAAIDGLFDFTDFVEIFDPSADYVVDLSLIGYATPPQAHETGLADIRTHVRNCIVDRTFEHGRLFNYSFPKAPRDVAHSVTRTDKSDYRCSSLDAAIAHFIDLTRTEGLVLVG